MKKVVASLLAVLMAAAAFGGCASDGGSKPDSSKTDSSSAASAGDSSQAESQAGEESSVTLLDPVSNTDGKLVLPRSQYVAYPVEAGDITLEYWATLHSNISNNPSTPTANETAWAQYWQENTGIQVHFTHPTQGSETAEFGVMVVSGTLPDIIEWSWTGYTGGVVAAEQEGVVT